MTRSSSTFTASHAPAPLSVPNVLSSFRCSDEHESSRSSRPASSEKPTRSHVRYCCMPTVRCTLTPHVVALLRVCMHRVARVDGVCRCRGRCTEHRPVRLSSLAEGRVAIVSRVVRHGGLSASLSEARRSAAHGSLSRVTLCISGERHGDRMFAARSTPSPRL